jgi:asparagine synthetase B (glutamine-hydrolysing)
VIGTNRLAIVDPLHGTQPFFNKARNVFVVFNGELYNSGELLPSLGSEVKTGCDTELVLLSYLKYDVYSHCF